ncbi:hypothetical protein V8G54_006895 [Vigna mungo]|uniref:Uncharacterized protein n=1 Tax=Vigna mungo TaxID=3915 RepID=A0AAQ3P1B0_VIGMU
MFNAKARSLSTSLIPTSCSFSFPLSELSLSKFLPRRSRLDPEDSLVVSMRETEFVVVVLVLAERERVLTVGVFGIEEEEEERRERLAEREVDEDEGAAEEASARFRLRVSIQNPDSPFQSI